MKTIGIVAEWNPFHNGHQYLIDCIRNDWPDACIVGVMSGAFCQRGEAPCFDKWVRTEMALAAGVDVVLELPQVYATASLEGFAHGGVASLLCFAPVDALYCGSESADEALLLAQATYLRRHKDAYDDYIQAASKSGISYTEASQGFLQEAGLALGKDAPNDRLALHYRLALPAEVPLHLVGRTISHTAANGRGAMMSASAIRRHLPENLDALADYLPQTSLSHMQKAFHNGWQMADDGPLLTALRVRLLGMETTELATILHIRDGWEHRFLEAALHAGDMESLLLDAQTKHYSRSRIRRLILQLLSPLPQAPPFPDYVRVLGFSDRGRMCLRKRTNKSPCLLNTAKDARALSPQARRILQGDIRRQNLSDFLSKQAPKQRDYLEPPRLYSVK